MTHIRLLCRVSCVAAALLLAPPAPLEGRPGARHASRPDPQPAAAEKQPCCFTNPQYTGVCVVQPGEGETCASILAYLNNPQSQGKSYCGNTSIRGAWKQTECAKKPSPSPDARP